ncbi:hypothetical protein L7F22_061209 [Adiantum nelumboides]|nr:hypothetical protein [Adiantum nelumboides]
MEIDSNDSDTDSEDSDRQKSISSKNRRYSSLLDDLDASGSRGGDGTKWKTHPTLDDAFFSIDQFNKDTDDYGDEGIDLGDDVDLFKNVGESDEEPVLYADFFAPPPGGTTGKGKGRAGATASDAPVPQTARKPSRRGGGGGGGEWEDEGEEGTGDKEGEEEEDVEMSVDGSDAELETVHRVAGDLFAAEDNGEQDAKSKEQSSHERRLEKLQREISRLEQENVAKKDWTLMGETGSRTRPENSLLAEPLDFENNQRAKPAVTPETTATLEDMVRKRILESNYDDVERRANREQFDFVPSRMLELSDSKSGKSLDQIYEDEMGLGNGQSHGEKMDKQLEQDHKDISKLYDELEYKLDALSNAHFTPRPPKATIQNDCQCADDQLEESLPSTSTHASQLAPEEVYDAGRHNEAWLGARSEMAPEEKKRLQRQLRADKKARQERIASAKRNVEINKEAFAKNRGGRFVGGAGKRPSSRNDAKEKGRGASQTHRQQGCDCCCKEGQEKKKRKPSEGTLNASHLKL